MMLIEQYRYPLFLALVLLSVAAFLGAKGLQPAPGAVADGAETAPVVEEITAGNCGVCTSQTGAQVDCYIPTQRYTCASKATACASLCQ